MMYCKYIIFLFVLLGYKNEQKSTSIEKNTLLSEEKSLDRDSLKWEEIDSCFISSNEIQLVLYENKNNADVFKLELLKKGIRTEKRIDLSGEDISNIKLKCEDNGFFILLNRSIGNDYWTTYHVFLFDEHSENLLGTKMYSSTSSRSGISIAGIEFVKGIEILEYDFKKKEQLELKEIYAFHGFQEGKSPTINEFLDLIQSSYKIGDYNDLELLGDRLVLEFMLDNIDLTEKNLSKYNDLGYYLEQAKLYTEAIFVLEKVIKKFPNRTVAYINLGDAYWGAKQKEEAKKIYKEYQLQMKEKGMTNKIPARVGHRIGE